MRKTLILVIAALLLAPSLYASAPDRDSVSVALATIFGDIVRRNLESLQSGGVEINDSLFAARFTLALQGKPTGMDINAANVLMQNVVSGSQSSDTADSEEQEALLRSARATEGAVVLPSGTVFIVLTEGEGKNPGPHDIATVTYAGRLADGTIFDATEAPLDLPVDNLVRGFTEALTEMLPGGTYRIVIPAEAAYGDRGVPGVIPAGSALDFTVTLHSSRPGEAGK